MSKSQDVSIAETDIAVVGMAGRFPGARTIQTFWNNLRNGVESVTSFTDEELLAAQVESRRPGRPKLCQVRCCTRRCG